MDKESLPSFCNQDELEDCLDYLYVQEVKAQTTKRFSLTEAERVLSLGINGR